ncbi:hypothetical protein Slala03_75830 [Streptomyces lavendulae subsp. lavendulae]|nr:hypothetical protein Slala03_75830 [Streptomyces lavendulae subsp. lavendulae]
MGDYPSRQSQLKLRATPPQQAITAQSRPFNQYRKSRREEIFGTNKQDAFKSKVARADDNKVALEIKATTRNDAGNAVTVKLMRVEGHKGKGREGFTIMTAFPGEAP